MLLRAIDDRPHAFLQRAVLRVDAVDAGKTLGALHRTIQPVVVRPVGLGPECCLIDMDRPVAEAALQPVFGIHRLVGGAERPVVDHGRFVIHRHPAMPGVHRQAAFGLRRPHLMERHDEVIGADMHLVVRQRADAGVLVAVVGQVHHKVGRLAGDERAGRLEPTARRGLADQPVQDRRVRGVQPAFQPLQPVALLDHLGDVAMGCRHLGPGEFRQRRDALGRAEIGPDDAAKLAGRIGCRADLVLEVVFRRLVHHVDATAVHVELPAVVDAAQPAFLVAAEV